MLLPTLILLAALTPQAPPAEAVPPESTALPETAPLPPEATALPEAASLPPEAPAPALGIEASEVPPSPASVGAFQESIEAGLKAFIRGRFSRARDAFEKAYEADPQSAAAAFYLGYAHYKVGEPQARMNADKEKARDLFARAYTLDPTFQPVWGQKPAVAE